MNGFLAAIKQLGSGIVYIEPLGAVDPGFGQRPPVDPGFGFPTFPRPDQGLPGQPVYPSQGLPGLPVRPDNGHPVPPVRPSVPIVLPPGMWPPTLPPGVDNTLPGVPSVPGFPTPPIFIPPDPSIGIEHPIVLPSLPPGSALLIALTGANVPQPKDVPPGAKPAILYQGAGTKPVLVYVTASATPK